MDDSELPPNAPEPPPEIVAPDPGANLQGVSLSVGGSATTSIASISAPNPARGIVAVIADPIPTRHTTLEEARQLATLPRHRFDDFTIAAFWGAVASAPGAYQAFVDLALKQPKDFRFDLVELGAFGASIVLAISGAFRGMGAITSQRYLRTLFPSEAPPSGPRGLALALLDWVAKLLLT
jgi:hypothetical protein